MKPNSIHLRPGALWIIFGPVLICMWIAAVNYTNNLVYAILYLIGSLSFVSLFHTWHNLSALRVEHIRVNPAFAGEDIRVEVHLRNVSRRTIYGIVFARYGEDVVPRRAVTRRLWRHWRPGQPLGLAERLGRFFDLFRSRRTAPMRMIDGRGVRIEPEDTYLAEAAFSSERRGVYLFDSLLVRTCYPFGLFWASIRVPVGAEYFVYPKPAGSAAWPGLQSGASAGPVNSPRSGDDFAGVRAYIPGESLRHVDWKAYARGRPLAVKQFTGGGGYELWLDASAMNRLPLEARLSQIALWIVNAEKEEIPYALRLGRTALPLGLGPAQSRRALETLAVAGVGSS
jgi:uncharacterized protein (DUF58 family)